MMNIPYKSEKLNIPQDVERHEGIIEKIQPYFAGDELQKAVNLAILLKRPLLLMGEPGCGKSAIAKAIAYEWYEKDMYSKKKYFEWNIKSTSKSKEGLYDFDHLLRLRDANLRIRGIDLKLNSRYRRFGPLAEAMQNSNESERAVLLIDEIDKADIDFSNDLLNELDRNSFYIPETNEKFSYGADSKPVIIITSNGERDLSDAFLRRCIFHYIDLFSPQKINSDETKRWLTKIISARFYKQLEPVNALIDKSIKTFIALRAAMNAETSGYRKSVNTSEFIDWFEALKRAKDGTAYGLEEDEELKEWEKSETGKTKIPFGNVLFKTTAALLNFKEI